MSTAPFTGHAVPFNSHDNPKKELGVIFISAYGETEAQKSDRTCSKSLSG